MCFYRGLSPIIADTVKLNVGNVVRYSGLMLWFFDRSLG